MLRLKSQILVMVLVLTSLIYLSSWEWNSTVPGERAPNLQLRQSLNSGSHHSRHQAAIRILPQQYVEHEPFTIDNSDDFVALGFLGEGSLSNPYVIEGLNITSTTQTLIKITDTTVYFCIRNNFLNGLTDTDAGISLHRVTHGTIDNNIVTNCASGIFLWRSKNTIVSHNTVSNSTRGGILLDESKNTTISHNTIPFCWSFYGIFLWRSRNNTVSHNTVSSCKEGGIVLDNSGNTTVSHNTVSSCIEGIILKNSGNTTISSNTIFGIHLEKIELYTIFGIHLEKSGQNTLIRNILLNCGLFIHGSDVKHYLQTNMEDNIINDRPLVCWQNVIGGTVPLGAGQVILINTTGVEVTGQNISRTSHGLLVAFSSNLDIHHNTISNVTRKSIYFKYSGHNTIANNIISSCTYGIYLWVSEHNTITHNILTNNDYSIYLWVSEHNTVSHNTISKCTFGICFKESWNNTVSHNIVSHNKYGILFYSTTEDNKVTWNEFLGNFADNCVDDGSFNVFTSNYWDDHDNADLNDDGNADVPYVITGAAANKDPIPIANPHSISIPTIEYPNGGEIFHGTITIQWEAAIDAWGHTVTYAVSYSVDGGNTWILLATGLPTHQYEWDTTTVVDGFTYLIKVIATCSESLTTEDISDASFTILNLSFTTTTSPPETITSLPQISSVPILGEPVSILLVTLLLAMVSVRKIKRKLR